MISSITRHSKPSAASNSEPIIEIDGKLQFGLPGQPIFPALSSDTILKPTLSWLLQSDRPGNTNAEFSYVTGGMSWHADYNVVAPVSGNLLDIVGWVTLDNQTGKTFSNAHIKLMAGDVNKLQPQGFSVNGSAFADLAAKSEATPAVTERSFDEYHLYTLERPSTLYDRETKQVEFVRATGVPSQRLYVYDGVKLDQNYRGYPLENIRDMENFGVQSNQQDLGDGGIQEQQGEPPRHAFAQRPRALLSSRYRRPDGIHR